MKLFEVSHSCLMEILYKKTPFKLAVENTCAKHTVFREDRKNLTNILGCSLRHYYIFEHLISRLEKEFNEEQQTALILYLSNQLFVPVLSAKEVESLLDKLSIDKKTVKALDELSKDKTKLIPEEFSNESIEYLHYRFNVPVWVLKMWMKHFKGYTYKIVKSINRPSNHYAIMTKVVSDKETLLKEHPEIKPTLIEGLYLFDGKVSPKRHSLFKEEKLVEISPAEYYLLSKLDLDVLRGIAAYTEVQNDLHLHLMGLLSKQYKMELIAGSPEALYDTKKDLESHGLNGVNLYEANHSSIITCLSEKVHTFFVMPKNANFAEFRKSPDYFNRVEQSSLDSYITNQKAALLNASDFVEENGNLIYTVSTMNKKETVQIVDDFLKERKDYALVEQKQFLPFDKYDSTLFIAIFRREGSND